MTKKEKVSDKTVIDAQAIAKSLQRPGQTKEQTKLIAQGIQKGIEHYKKQHKAKLREQDKRKKLSDKSKSNHTSGSESNVENKAPRLPWILLATSWLLFISYVVLFQIHFFQ